MTGEPLLLPRRARTTRAPRAVVDAFHRLVRQHHDLDVAGTAAGSS